MSESSRLSETRSVEEQEEKKAGENAVVALSLEAVNVGGAIQPLQSETRVESSVDPELGYRKLKYQSENRFQRTLKRRDNNLVLSWKDLTYSVKVKPLKEYKPGMQKPSLLSSFKKTEKKILHGLSGYVHPGQFLAIIGPSGSGKTTLLNLLAKRVKDGIIGGEVLVNGKPIHKKQFRQVSGYVMQEDILFAHLTVYETLVYAARLKLPQSMTDEEKEQRVQSVIEELGLKSVVNTAIGNEQVRGVSGGERKRVNIANEMVTNPAILFLDEPTSGLDSFTALSIIQTLGSLARNNYSVVCTIHQPRYNIFELFDMLCVLSQGEMVYFGPAKNAVAYFSSLTYVCPKYYNPADFFLDVVTIDNRSPEAAEASTKRAAILQLTYKSSEMAQDALHPPEEYLLAHKMDGETANPFQQFQILLGRTFKNTYRDKGLTFFRGFQALFISLLVGLAFLQLKHDQIAVQNRRGVLFILLMNQMMGPLFLVFNVFPRERKVVHKETQAGLYSVLVYFVAKNLVDLPLTLFFPIIVGTIAYWMVGLNTIFTHFIIFLVVLDLMSVVAESYGYAITTWFPKKAMASVISLLVLLLFITFGGFYLNKNNTPKEFLWIQYISFVRYGFEALVVNEFQATAVYCLNSTSSSPYASGTNRTLIPVANGTYYDPLACQFNTGDDVVHQLGFSTRGGVIVEDIVILIGMILFLRVVAYFGLRYMPPSEEAY